MIRSLSLALMLACVAACGNRTEQDEPPAPAAQPAAPALAPVAPPRAAPLPPPSPQQPTGEELPLPDDFADEVARDITAESYKAELDDLGREIATHP